MPQQEWKYEKNKIALPTVGRMVHVYHDKEPGPMAAIVAFVHPVSGMNAQGDGYDINAHVIAQSGDIILGGLQHIPHISYRPPTVPFYWDWMPYQKGQAAKTEQLQAELDAKALPK